MSDDRPARETGFLEILRRESVHGPGRGLGRLARLFSGGAGLARRVMKAGRAGAGAELSEKDLRKLETLVRQLGDLKGLPMKLGQIMSYLEVEMPEEMRRVLSLLQTQSPATPRPEVERVLREDLGARGATLWEGLDLDPVSIASIGQVYRGRLPEGTEVAVKVRHPAIDEAIRSDFQVASNVMSVVGAVLPGMGATARDFVAEMKARLLEECDYGLEAERQRLFGQLFAHHDAVEVPAVHDGWCAQRVLTSTWRDGLDLETFRTTASQAARDAAGEALFDFYIGTLYRHGLFHADPHPGNYRFRDGGRVVVFDYGCVRVFEPEVARAFAALAQAVREDERPAIEEALRGLGAEPSKNDRTFDRLRGLLRSFFGPMLQPGPHRIEGRIVVRMGDIARDKMAVARLRLPGRLVFLFRIRFGLFAVLSRLGAVADWAALERRFHEESHAPRPSPMP